MNASLDSAELSCVLWPPYAVSRFQVRFLSRLEYLEHIVAADISMQHRTSEYNQRKALVSERMLATRVKRVPRHLQGGGCDVSTGVEYLVFWELWQTFSVAGGLLAPQEGLHSES